MKYIVITIAFLITLVMSSNTKAQSGDKSSSEKFGNTLNLGVGFGYHGHVGRALPALTFNYEFDVARNFTLAPFAGIYSYRANYYWGNPGSPKWDPSYRQYSYRETAIPLGVKGTYYFDQLLEANSKWDFYAAGSLGFVVKSVSWENGYYGDRTVYQSGSPVFLDIHIGSEYHLNQKAGLFLDLSTGISTGGLALHF